MKHSKQHYVPRSYLAEWCDPAVPPKQTPYVWMFSRDGSSEKRKAPENIFCETDMYTINFDGDRNLHLEHGLSTLEDQFVRIRENKISSHKSLTVDEWIMLCAFTAAMHGRTKAQRDHFRKTWEEVLRMGENISRAHRQATPEKQRQMESVATPNDSKDNSMTMDDVKELARHPIQHALPQIIRSSLRLLPKMSLAIFETDNDVGFITSDAPCVWYDPTWHKKPPFYRSVGLVDENIEITLPISPKQLLFLSWHPHVVGYFSLGINWVQEFNRRTRFRCSEYFVVRKNYKDKFWFDPGREPEDTWEKEQAKKSRKDQQDS